MSFNWYEYFDLAQFLHTNGNNLTKATRESAYRSAVSRAYYAAFCHAREYICKNYGFIPTKTGKDHKLVRNEFSRRGLNRTANQLKVLHQWRKQCDYDNSVNGINSMVQKAIMIAREIFNNL